EYTSNRHYTLSQASNPNEYRISVKREDACDPKGVVSNYLHNNVNEGDFIDVSAPAGLFTLSETNNPTLFISGGIGVTPLNTMLQAMEPGRDVTFVHTARNKNVIAFQEQIENKVKELNGTYRAYYSDSEGYITK
ncbi:nitric oxide dioxygenase, partial [Butyricicoccus sp. 1XD8-22]